MRGLTDPIVEVTRPDGTVLRMRSSHLDGYWPMTLTVDGVSYRTVGNLTWSSEFGDGDLGERLLITDGSQEPYDQCDRCGRADWRPREARSLDEAVGYGWLIPISAIRERQEGEG